MNFGPTSNEEHMDAILLECKEAFQHGSMPLMQLIARSMVKGGLPVRVFYMMGGIKALGEVNLDVIHAFFKYLEFNTPSEEKALHEQAVEMVFNNMVKAILANTQGVVDSIAQSVGVKVNMVFTHNMDQSIGWQDPTETANGHTLH